MRGHFHYKWHQWRLRGLWRRRLVRRRGLRRGSWRSQWRRRRMRVVMVSAAQMQDQKQLKMRAKYTLQNFATCLHFTLQMFRCMNLHWLLELTTTPSSWFSVTIFTYCYILKQHETCILYNTVYIIKNTFLRTWCCFRGTSRCSSNHNQPSFWA